jgi:hypothetical protein
MAVVYKNENFKLLSFSMGEAWKIMLALKKGSMVVKKKKIKERSASWGR